LKKVFFVIFNHFLFSLVLQVNAYDRDLGFNGDLLYVISDGDVDSVFRIDISTGQLFVDGVLDRETTPEYTLNITVLDQVRIIAQLTFGDIQIMREDLEGGDRQEGFKVSYVNFFYLKNMTLCNAVESKIYV